MTEDKNSITLNLNSEEQEAVAALQQEMGMNDPGAVVHMLLRQAAQQAGFRASMKRGQTLANYEEVRIRHLHRTIDEYLARG